MTDSPYPILDPETGEVLAASEDEAAEVAQMLGELLINAERTVAQAREAIPDLRRRLGLVMTSPVTDDEGWTAYWSPAPTPPRSVDRQAVIDHAEALKPIGLGPVPQPPKPQPDKVPGVAAFTSKKAREDLARLRLTPETFVKDGERGEDRIEVVAPARQPADLSA